MSKYDLIIIGGGGFGCSTAYYAARRGKKVLVLDQFGQGHDLGSSHGGTRIIRKAYFEHPDYVPLLQQGYKLWTKLEEISSRELLSPCGLMLSGQPESAVISGAREAAELHTLELEDMSTEEIEDRFPGYRIPDGQEVIYECDGGFLHVEDCVDTYITLAEKRGVEFRWNEPVTHWESDGETAKVWTEGTTYEADALVITAGAWASQSLADLPGFPQLSVLRKVMFWFPVMSDAYDYSMGSSCFFFEMPYGEFYGFPSLDGQSIKVCQHSGGEPVADPAQVDREFREEDMELVARFLGEVMPEVVPKPEDFAVCMYTMTPDSHFIVDRHPHYQNVVIGAGFSGHGFKFASVLGKALSDLAIDYETDLPVGFLGLERFKD